MRLEGAWAGDVVSASMQAFPRPGRFLWQFGANSIVFAAGFDAQLAAQAQRFNLHDWSLWHDRLMVARPPILHMALPWPSAMVAAEVRVN